MESNVLAYGRVHPRGEPDQEAPNTLYYTEGQMSKLATELEAKPVCVEHKEAHPVGQIHHSRVDPKDKCCYALFETDGTSAGGQLANCLVGSGLCGELSLGHEAEFDPTTSRVGQKRAREVSIVMKGARDGTHILKGDRGTMAQLKALKAAQTATRAEHHEMFKAVTTLDAKREAGVDLRRQPPYLQDALAVAARRSSENLRRTQREMGRLQAMQPSRCLQAALVSAKHRTDGHYAQAKRAVEATQRIRNDQRQLRDTIARSLGR